MQHIDDIVINREQHAVLVIERPAKYAGRKMIVLRRHRKSLWHVDERLQKRIEPLKPLHSSCRRALRGNKIRGFGDLLRRD